MGHWKKIKEEINKYLEKNNNENMIKQTYGTQQNQCQEGSM